MEQRRLGKKCVGIPCRVKRTMARPAQPWSSTHACLGMKMEGNFLLLLFFFLENTFFKITTTSSVTLSHSFSEKKIKEGFFFWRDKK